MGSENIMPQCFNLDKYSSKKLSENYKSNKVNSKHKPLEAKENVVVEHNDINPNHMRKLPVFRAKKMSMKIDNSKPVVRLEFENSPLTNNDGLINALKSTRMIKKPLMRQNVS